MQQPATIKLGAEVELAIALIRIEIPSLANKRLQALAEYQQDRIRWLETTFMYRDQPAVVTAAPKRRARTKGAGRRR